MIKVESKDKVLEVEDAVVETIKDVPDSEEGAVEVATATIEKEDLEEAIKENASKSELNPPEFMPMTELEYASIAKTMATIQKLRELNQSDEAQTQINFLEMSIWDDLVKRFGFSSVESGQSAGFTFGLKRVFGIECKKK
tara:strand:+ start:2158 stop:2577 length:420 start_codon:yes stop_codon:yes gene_type:complete